MRFSTWRALGNTYRVVEREDVPLDVRAARELAADTDGVLEVVAEAPGSVEIVIWNPDGSQAELSGNGTRIAAAWLASRTGAEEVEVVTAGRVTQARLLPSGEIEQELGEVSVGAVETVDGVTFTPVSVGNPHAVIRVPSVADAPVGRLGPAIENHPRFPKRTNVGFMEVVDRGHIRLRVHERGTGETRACGTGACAAVAVGRRHGLLDENVQVDLPGGRLDIQWKGPGEPIWMTGPAETAYEGEVPT